MKIETGIYSLGGLDVTSIAKEFGTPLYLYHAESIRDKYNQLAHSFSGINLDIHYACKANSNINILKYLRNLGAGLDTVSIEEARLGINVGYDPKKIIFTPNSVSLSEYEEAVELGVIINIDNISILEQFGLKYNSRVPVCIRINPHILAGGHGKISTGHIDSKFGISVHQLRHVERIVEANKMTVEGLHMHTGSDILEPDVFLRSADILFEHAMQFPGLKYIDFGSGFKVPYHSNDVYTDVTEFGKKFSSRFKEFCNQYGKELKVKFEPGKFLVSESGFLLASVNTVKTTTATVFAGLDTGFNHLIRPMFYDSWHEIVNISNPEGTPGIYTVVGNICETDTFAWDRKINRIHEGDILAFCNAGAYGYAMSSNFNLRPRPAEVMVMDGKAYLIRERENPDDFLKGQVEVVE